MKKILYRILAISIGIFFALIITEVFLRIYNPFHFRVKGDQIILPANKKYVIKNNKSLQLDSLIIHTKNSLGFRGPEIPNDYDKYISIIAVGGSTTECFYLADGKDWPAQLSNKLGNDFENIWINNAGLDGHSTFGHLILLKDYLVKIKPDYILFLVGSNDVGREDLNIFDKDKMQGEYLSIKNWFTKNSEVVALIVNISRGLRAEKRKLGHSLEPITEYPHETVDSVYTDKVLSENIKYAELYRQRLTELVSVCKTNHIIPILITQPTLAGVGNDDRTSVNLETIMLFNDPGFTMWKLLEEYNHVTKEVAAKEHLLVIDLANELPKSSYYFYDGLHFTNEGGKKIGDILYQHLRTFLKPAAADSTSN